ncbi:MAG TPA: hypothetical protein PKA31_03360 [Candidatus Moranbacteria bacterium]|nr:hypothetical protein [Candidatus Moranbacteria bacterium]
MKNVRVLVLLFSVLFLSGTVQGGNLQWGFGIGGGGHWGVGIWHGGPYFHYPPYRAYPQPYFPYYPHLGFFPNQGWYYAPPPDMRSNWATYAQGKEDGFSLGYEDGQNTAWRGIIRSCPDEYCLGFNEGYRQGFIAGKNSR